MPFFIKRHPDGCQKNANVERTCGRPRPLQRVFTGRGVVEPQVKKGQSICSGPTCSVPKELISIGQSTVRKPACCAVGIKAGLKKPMRMANREELPRRNSSRWRSGCPVSQTGTPLNRSTSALIPRIARPVIDDRQSGSFFVSCNIQESIWIGNARNLSRCLALIPGTNGIRGRQTRRDMPINQVTKGNCSFRRTLKS